MEQAKTHPRRRPSAYERYLRVVLARVVAAREEEPIVREQILSDLEDDLASTLAAFEEHAA